MLGKRIKEYSHCSTSGSLENKHLLRHHFFPKYFGSAHSQGTGWPTLPACYLGPQVKFCSPLQHGWVVSQCSKEHLNLQSLRSTHISERQDMGTGRDRQVALERLS